MMDFTTVTLNNGAKMPIIGFGTFNPSNKGEIGVAVESAIDRGYRLFDCGLFYNNESEIGEAFQNKIKQGEVKRKDLFVTTKLWSTHFRCVRECLNKSLERLKLGYVDLYLIHFPAGIQYVGNEDFLPVDQDGKLLLDETIHYAEVWKEMENLKNDGLAKAIGISNFNEYQINKLMETANIKPAVHQFERHPYLAQESLLQFCLHKGIAVTAYSPLGSPANPWANHEDPVVLNDPKLAEIAAKHGKTVAQVMLRYQLDNDVVVIPKSVTLSHIKSNFQIFDFSLDAKDLDEIRSLDRNCRISKFDMFKYHKFYPFKSNYSES